jgi:hypothetical protein
VEIYASASQAAVPLGGIDECVLRYQGIVKPDGFDIDMVDRYRTVCENILAGQYRLETLATSQRIYANQMFQNSVVLWMVVVITVSGVILAGIQLWATYRLALEGKGAIAEGGEATIEHGKLVVRSSVVGIIILALSFAFFAVYVLYVYRITDLPGIETIVAPARSTDGAEAIAR